MSNNLTRVATSVQLTQLQDLCFVTPRICPATVVFVTVAQQRQTSVQLTQFPDESFDAPRIKIAARQGRSVVLSTNGSYQRFNRHFRLLRVVILERNL